MKILYGVLLAIIVFSCQNNNAEEASVSAKDSVTGKWLDERFSQAWNRKDSASILQQLSDDVEVLSGTARYKGLREAREQWVSYELPISSQLKTQVLQYGQNDSLAYSLGTFSLQVAPPGVKSFAIKGNYSFVWTRSKDGSWTMKTALIEDLPR